MMTKLYNRVTDQIVKVHLVDQFLGAVDDPDNWIDAGLLGQNVDPDTSVSQENPVLKADGALPAEVLPSVDAPEPEPSFLPHTEEDHPTDGAA